MWDGKNVYDIDEIPSIEFVDQKVNADGLAEGTGYKMDDFFPIFIIIITDWLVNFMSTMVFLTISFLFSFEPSEVDTIQRNQTPIQLFIFILNITIKNLVIVGGIMANSQFIAYDIQLFELSLDLVLIGAATCSAIITFARYLLYDEMVTMDSLRSLKH